MKKIQMIESPRWKIPKPTGLLVLADGNVIEGQGFGACGAKVGEICFNTAITGYQEILTDPSYNEQIVTFTFPHIGNTGVNKEDIENLDSTVHSGAVGVIVRTKPSSPSNFRATLNLNDWLKSRGIIGLCNVDTRALTIHIREKGALHAVIAHSEDGLFNIEDLKLQAKSWSGLTNTDLTHKVTSTQSSPWTQTSWNPNSGYGQQTQAATHIVVIDYGIKRNILRLLAGVKSQITVVPATTAAKEIKALKPDGVLLSNGPGDPAATAEYAVPIIKALLDAEIPIFGICLGHQILALALGGKTQKMTQGHHGANHPVKNKKTGKIEITSMNHGFTVITSSLPDNIEETHISLFDGSNCGLAVKEKPVFSVQYHPEGSPGPQDSHYLFTHFINMVHENKSKQ